MVRARPDEVGRVQEALARELEQRSEALEELLEKARAGHVTLVFSARDTAHNNAVALKEHLECQLNA